MNNIYKTPSFKENSGYVYDSATVYILLGEIKLSIIFGEFDGNDLLDERRNFATYEQICDLLLAFKKLIDNVGYPVDGDLIADKTDCHTVMGGKYFDSTENQIIYHVS